jgi:hypothetical protein
MRWQCVLWVDVGVAIRGLRLRLVLLVTNLENRTD